MNNKLKRRPLKKVLPLKLNNVNCGLPITNPQKNQEPPRDLLLKRFNRFWLRDYQACLNISKKELINEEISFVENIYRDFEVISYNSTEKFKI